MSAHTPKLLQRILRYDPVTGLLYWRRRGPDLFSNGRAAGWNTRFSGRETFVYEGYDGYRRGVVMGRNYLAHRVAWAVMNGDWPDGEIDHINGLRNDNRSLNLRQVSRQDNCRNKKISRANTSGHTGVNWCKRTNKWLAKIKVSDREIYLGWFEEIDDAASARKDAETKYGFHENHGRI